MKVLSPDAFLPPSLHSFACFPLFRCDSCCVIRLLSSREIEKIKRRGEGGGGEKFLGGRREMLCRFDSEAVAVTVNRTKSIVGAVCIWREFSIMQAIPHYSSILWTHATHLLDDFPR
jgi:hypothetical protein